jgi:hypothetical protein
MLANGIRLLLLIPSTQVLSNEFLDVTLLDICNIQSKDLEQGGEL